MRSTKNVYIFNKTRARARETVKHPISLTLPIRKKPQLWSTNPKPNHSIDKRFIRLPRLLIIFHAP